MLGNLCAVQRIIFSALLHFVARLLVECLNTCTSESCLYGSRAKRNKSVSRARLGKAQLGISRRSHRRASNMAMHHWCHAIVLFKSTTTVHSTGSVRRYYAWFNCSRSLGLRRLQIRRRSSSSLSRIHTQTDTITHLHQPPPPPPRAQWYSHARSRGYYVFAPYQRAWCPGT